MSITYTTSVTSMQVAKSMGGYDDVVTAVNWVVAASDGTYFAQGSGVSPVGPIDPADFTPYSDLTQEHVLSWISDPATPELQASLADNITVQVTAVISMTPPWS